MDFLKELFGVEDEAPERPKYMDLSPESADRVFHIYESKTKVFFKEFFKIILAIIVVGGLAVWFFIAVSKPVPQPKSITKPPRIVIVETVAPQPIPTQPSAPAVSSPVPPATTTVPSTQPYRSSSSSNKNSSSSGLFDMLGFIINPIMDLVGKVDIEAGKKDLENLILILKDPMSDGATAAFDYYKQRILDTINDSTILPTEIKGMLRDFVETTLSTVENRFDSGFVKNVVLKGPENIRLVIDKIKQASDSGEEITPELIKEIFESVFNS